MQQTFFIEALLKRILFVAVLTFLVSLSFIPLGYSAEPFGTNLGSFDGVIAYSNCSNYCVSCNNYCNDLNYAEDSTYIGVKWQCVEYVRRYYYEVFDIDLASKHRGDAKTFYDHATDMGLNGYPNGGTFPPQVGDILVSEGTDANVGHVAIVRSVTDNQVCTIQQNFSNDSRDINRCLTLNVSNGSYTVSGFGASYSIAGWLRNPEQSGTTTTTINPIIAQTPMFGPPGETFAQWGTGFTPDSTATLHFEMPDGTEYPTDSQSIDSTGHFETTYTTQYDKPAGTYTWWAIDGPTGVKSNEISYEITDAFYAIEVEGFDINTSHDNTAMAVGPPDECTSPCDWQDGPGYFVSLGGGYIIATMERWFSDGPGADMRIFEVGSRQGGSNESFDVYISSDSSDENNWIKVADNAHNDSGKVYASIDIAGNSGSYKYVSIVVGGSGGRATSGADIDAIQIIGSALITTTSTTSQPTTSSSSIITTTTTSVNSTTTSCEENDLCCTENAYGEHSSQAKLLRYFRDKVLSQTPEGRELIKLYYLWSPTIVRAMEGDDEFKQWVKEMIDSVLPMIERELE